MIEKRRADEDEGVTVYSQNHLTKLKGMSQLIKPRDLEEFHRARISYPGSDAIRNQKRKPKRKASVKQVKLAVGTSPPLISAF